MQVGEVQARRSGGESEHLDTGDLLVVVVAQNHARNGLDGLDDVRAVEAQRQGIGLLVDS